MVEDRMVEIMAVKQNIKKKKMNEKKKKKTAWVRWDSIKHTDICMIGVPWEEKERTWENIWKGWKLR